MWVSQWVSQWVITQFLPTFQLQVCSVTSVTSSSQRVLSLFSSGPWSATADCTRPISSFKRAFRSCRGKKTVPLKSEWSFFYDRWTFKTVLQGCPTTCPALFGPSTEFVDSSPGSPSVAAPCLSPCGWSPSLCQRCFARLGLAPDTSASSVQTVRPALSERPDSLPCGSR